MSARTAAFDQELRGTAVPALSVHSFRFDGRRTFRRISEDQRIAQIIHFQLGQRSMAGKFTVNLGVFVAGDRPGLPANLAQEHDCPAERRIRIGELLPPRFPRLSGLPWVGILFGAADTWWAFPDDPTRTATALAPAIAAIQTHGRQWLDAKRPADMRSDRSGYASMESAG